MHYRALLTVMLNLALCVFPLWSVALHATPVRPSLKSVPDRGLHDTLTRPSTSSAAVTAYLTRTRFALAGARMTFETAPRIVGGVRSKSNPGTVSVPTQVSLPTE